jgi:hypothetical protein
MTMIQPHEKVHSEAVRSLRRQRLKTSNACEACRSRKCKCDGETPGEFLYSINYCFAIADSLVCLKHVRNAFHVGTVAHTSQMLHLPKPGVAPRSDLDWSPGVVPLPPVVPACRLRNLFQTYQSTCS